MLVSALVSLLLAAGPPKPAALPKARPLRLSQKIMDAMACAAPATAGGLIGIHAMQVVTGRVIHSYNAQNAFIPASNTKLFSTALALTKLGPKYVFTTRIAADREPDERGVLAGDLSFLGSGDPTLGSRSFARVFGQPSTPDVVGELADALVAKGVRHIKGSVVGDETLYPADPYPTGWAVDDPLTDSGAAVSALTIHDNIQLITASPWAFRFTPAVEYFTVFNQIRPGGEEPNIRVDRVGTAGRQLILSGTAPVDRAVTELVGVDEPALFTATLLHEALTKRGVQIDGPPRVRSRRAGDPLPVTPKAVLAEHQSPPLIEILRVIDKVSQNLHAELVLREAGRVAAGDGTREAGLREMQSLVWRSGADGSCCSFQDGSGMSRLNLVTPQAATRLLTYMYRSEYRDSWMSLLPIGGVDGTLSKRFEGEEENGRRVLAKTGSLSHVSTLAGYIHSKTYGELAFSVMFNNFNGAPSDARGVIDKIALALAE